MTILKRTNILSYLGFNPKIIFCDTKYLFLLSHMRSRSTVLSHILGSNSDICGYKELKLSYNGRLSLMLMRIKIINDLKCEIKNKYLLDKILHDNYDISDKIFKVANPKVIFLLRDPENTLKSIMNMGIKLDMEWYRNPSMATDYYCSRLLRLEDYAIKIGKGNLFIQSDDLVNKTDFTLNKIKTWLELEEPLKNKYSIYKDTGVYGYGDPLSNINHGVLVKTQNYKDIKIPNDLFIKAEESYNKCKEVLLKYVVSV